MDHSCHHRPRPLGSLAVVACGECGSVEWFEAGRPLDAAAGMAAAFGDFDLVGSVPAVGAPAPEVLCYRPPRRSARSALDALPPFTWLRVQQDLWLCHDGELMLLAPTDPLLVRNLTRGALGSP